MAKKKCRRSSFTPGEILLFVAGILFCLILITTAMMGGLFARYVATGTGSDNARVAKFGDLTLTETGDFDGTTEKKGMIIPGVPLQKKAVVDFEGSEMATDVFVEVILSPNWKTLDNETFWAGTHINWTVDDQWEYLKRDTLDGMNRFIYSKILQPNETLSADIIANDGEIVISSQIQKDQITALEDYFINLRAGVIQSGGFETVDEAWTALDSK